MEKQSKGVLFAELAGRTLAGVFGWLLVFMGSLGDLAYQPSVQMLFRPSRVFRRHRETGEKHSQMALWAFHGSDSSASNSGTKLVFPMRGKLRRSRRGGCHISTGVLVNVWCVDRGFRYRHRIHHWQSFGI